jgi:chromosomal replication initiator protein
MIDQQKILNTVCSHFNVTYEDIIEQNRKKEIVSIRMILAYLMQKYSGLTLHNIGYLMHRNHATVLHSINKVKIELEVYKDVQDHISDLKQILFKSDVVIHNVDLLRIAEINTLSKNYLN